MISVGSPTSPDFLRLRSARGRMVVSLRCRQRASVDPRSSEVQKSPAKVWHSPAAPRGATSVRALQQPGRLASGVALAVCSSALIHTGRNANASLTGKRQVTVHLELIQDQIKKRMKNEMIFFCLLFPGKHTNPHTLLPRYSGP